MALRPAYSLMKVEFDNFLFAPVGVECNGMPLSVISALTRLDFDPWEKAAQLSSLAVGDAVQALAPLIARLPVGRWELKDASTIAARLVSLLPRHAPLGPQPAGTHPPENARFQLFVWLICLVLLAAGLFGTMQGGGSSPSNGPSSGAISQFASPAAAEK
jgi:hypothetical protein